MKKLTPKLSIMLCNKFLRKIKTIVLSFARHLGMPTLSYLNKDPHLSLACTHFLEMIVSSFFKKGKNQFWKLLEKSEKFHDCFSNLGVQYEMSEEVFKQLEEFVCYLCGMRIKSVNEVRWRLFEKKYERTK